MIVLGTPYLLLLAGIASAAPSLFDSKSQLVLDSGGSKHSERVNVTLHVMSRCPDAVSSSHHTRSKLIS
jgi:hypothetical protein